MKKNLVLFSSLVLGVLAVNSFNTEAHAEKLSDGKSTAELQMLAGNENEIRPPAGGEDPTDPENPGTGNTGLLTIDRVPNITFGEVNISGSDQVEYAMNENPYTQVTDVRGTSAGWTLYARADAFTSAAKDELKGATLSLNNNEVVSASTGKAIVAPKGFDVTLTAKNQRVMMADKKAGEGTWMQKWTKAAADEKNKSIQLAILAGTAKANTAYTTTIYWELQDAPGK
ncbi:hypothetical protein DOK67_0002043 [Enterococcus sp. DIV0212c]|uniref:WxL domain-containing protein n=1 Tax=Enterococcus sp. DIV0212c TaxID=2230867 RepID=UPI001A9B01A2|nr:WxL domain-containing protein [Enterococcus sp. DIV0212c]MBO1354779.1 WxL domain-containing protein [Enterococcus sp. DIV0212c]